MGAKLAHFYEEAKTVGGLKAMMRLAVLTTVPSAKAESIPDSSELVQKFQEAINQIKKEG